MIGDNYPSSQDIAITLTQYVLDPSIPSKLKEEFEEYWAMFCNIMALGQIDKWDIFAMLLAFDEVCDYLNMGMYRDARMLMGRELVKMQATRSIGGKAMEYLLSRSEKVESVESLMSRKQRKKSIIGKISSAIRGEPKEKEIQYEGEE